MRLLFAALLLVFLAWSYAYPEEMVIPLKAVKVLPVEGLKNNQPSGLTIFNNTLYVVSDKHDDTIFRIQFMDDKAVMVPHVQFKLTEGITGKVLDFEGITCDEEGNFYIVSETGFRILKVSADGRKTTWLTPSLRSDGKKVGLFQARGAYLEGIALVDKGKFVLCAERQSRGIIRVDTSTTPIRVKASKYNRTRAKMAKYRQPDFTGLFWENGTLYVLERNTYAICKLIESSRGLEERDFWSYESIVTSEEFQYDNMMFGRAEGLCMDKKHVYVILDNNGDARRLDPDDRRPLLLIMERPGIKE